jgi:hypothetical protein
LFIINCCSFLGKFALSKPLERPCGDGKTPWLRYFLPIVAKRYCQFSQQRRMGISTNFLTNGYK